MKNQGGKCELKKEVNILKGKLQRTGVGTRQAEGPGRFSPGEQEVGWDGRTFLGGPALEGGGNDLGTQGLLLVSQAQPAVCVNVLPVASNRNQFVAA